MEQGISSVCFDSREAKPDSLFVAVKGTQVDGHDFIDKAIQKGAIGIVCEAIPEKIEDGISYVVVKDSNEALGIIAANFYDNPAKKMKLVAVTGTNGKTTVASLLFQLFRNLGYNVGLLSTVSNKINEEVIPATHTTPDALNLNKLLYKMRSQGCTHCFMEASFPCY